MVRGKIKNAIKLLFDGVCDIYRNVLKEDESGISYGTYEKIYENMPCRISYKSDGQSEESETITRAQQVVRIFFSNECLIESGDIFCVTQNGKSEKYKSCGRIRVYENHIECEAEIFDESV
jgi:hypothetical protein